VAALQTRGGGAPRNGAKAESGRRPEENRREPRFRSHLRTGQISDLQHNLIANCLICDRSASGARLKVPVNVAVPSEFLFLDDEIQAPVRVQLRWRRAGEMGVCVVGMRPTRRQ
jgi:hypothetical protein